MLLTDIYNHLTTGEFSQLAIGNAQAGEINEQNYPIVAAQINVALTKLYTRFNLKQRQLTLALQQGQTHYPLKKEYTQSTLYSPVLVRTILDADDPFTEDIIKIRSVTTADGFELPLNQPADPLTVSTPQLTQLLEIPALLVSGRGDIPEHLKTGTLIVHYQANHPKITEDMGLYFPEDMVLQLPDTHLQALLYYVAGRFQKPMAQNNEPGIGDSYMMLYERECQRLENAGMQIDDLEGETRFEQMGWR